MCVFRYIRWLLCARNCFVIFRRWGNCFYRSFKVTCKATAPGLISQPLKRTYLIPFPLWNLKSAFLLSLFLPGAILLFFHSRVLKVEVWMLKPAAPESVCQICSPAAASEASAEACAQIPSPSLPIPLRSCVLSVIACFQRRLPTWQRWDETTSTLSDWIKTVLFGRINYPGDWFTPVWTPQRREMSFMGLSMRKCPPR